MGQFHLQGNRKATREIQIVVLLLLQQFGVMLKGHPGFILGVAWSSWWQMSPVNARFVTCLQSNLLQLGSAPQCCPLGPWSQPGHAGGFSTPFSSGLASFAGDRAEKLLA